MIKLRSLGRLLHINRVLIKHGLEEWVFALPKLRVLRFLNRLSPSYHRRDIDAPLGVRIRCTLEELGPIFVKFGQTLSTRRDLLPENIAEELVKLQDQVPPFSGELARQHIEQALQQPIAALFAQFDETPLASASIAQVHAARLPSGEQVVIKVLRPGIEQRIRHDIVLLQQMALLARRFWPLAKRLRPVEVVEEFAKTITDELDLMREAANAAELRRHFENSQILYIPKIYWEYTRRNVLVMERIYGTPIDDVAALRAQQVDLKLLAERGVEIFFTQVFRDNFFHADMHAGNIFADTDARYLAVDFGIVGSLSKSDQHYLAENFMAFFNRDYHRVAEMHVESGWVPRTTRVEEFEAAIRSVCEPIFEKPLKDISYGQLLLRLFQTARRFDMEVQPQLVLLQKTLLNIEGLGRQLYPDLDLWQTAKPFLEKWFKQQFGPKASFDKVREQLPEWMIQLPDYPALIHRITTQTAHGQLEVQLRSRELTELREQLAGNQRKTSLTLVGCTALTCAVLLFGFTGTAGLAVGSLTMLGIILLVIALQ